MFLLVYFFIFSLDVYECAKPRSVNLALETVFEFDNETDITFVESVQDFLSKIKGALEMSYRRNDETRRFNTLLLTEFIEDTIKILKSYNDLDLSYFIELLDTELNEHEYENCEVKITNEISLRKFIAEKLSDVRNSPVEDIRETLDDILRKLKYKRDNRSRMYNILNSLVKRHSQERFRNILNNLHLYRHRRMDPSMSLRAVVQDSIRSLIKDYICNMNLSHSKKIRNIIQMLYEDSEENFPKLQTGRYWDKHHKKGIEKKNFMYDMGTLDDHWNYDNMQKHANNYSGDERYKKQKYKKTEPQSNNNRKVTGKNGNRFKKGKYNASLTNSDDVLDLKIDYDDYQEFETTLNNTFRYFNDATKITLKTKHKGTNNPYLNKKNYIDKSDDSGSSSSWSSESKEKRSRLLENTIVQTTRNLERTQRKRLKTFVTLYPEIISYMTRSAKKNKKSTDKIRKSFSKLNKDQNKDQIKEKADRNLVKEGVIHIRDIDITIGANKSLQSEEILKNSHKKRYKIKTNLSTLKVQGDKNTKEAFQYEKTSKNINNEGSSKKYNEVEHFGSLYKQRNNQTPVFIYRGYRKSNVATDTKKPETIKTTVMTTKTFVAQELWRGTKKATIKTPTIKNTDKEIFSKPSSLNTASKNISTLEPNEATAVGVRSQILNTNNIQSEKNYTSSDEDIIENITKHRNDTTNHSFSNSITMETKKDLNTVKQSDLRRYFDNSIINDINNDLQKMKMSQRFEEDLNKVFMKPSVQTTNQSKEFNTDPIDDIEAAFDLR